MSGTLLIPILVAVGMLAGIAAMFHLSNTRGSKNRGRRRVTDEMRGGNGAASQRKMDVRVLSASEKRLYAQAQTLLKEGKVQAGARILEQLNMQRESIQALEDAKLIHEAAKVLMRMGRHNRAGVVYARHGMWLDAASSFKMAQMPLEVAKCAREAGRFDLAAEFFEKAGRHDDAGEMFEKVGDLHKAARYFSAAGNAARAMALYAKHAEKPDATFEGDELKAIVAHLCEGNLEPALVGIAVKNNKAAEIVLQLIIKNLPSQARDVYQSSAADIGPKLMGDVSYRDQSAEALAQLFLSVSHFQYAGMVFERMTSFERAGAAFEAAEDYERSAYCFERAGRDDKAAPMRAKAESAEAPVPSKKYAAGGFALSNLPSEGTPRASFEDNGDSTAVMDTNDAAAEEAPPPPKMPLPPHLRPAPPPRAAPPPPTFALGDDEPPLPEDVPAIPALRVVAPAPAPEPPSYEPPPYDDVPNPAGAAPPAAIPAAVPPPPIIEGPGHAAFHRAKFLSDLDFEQKNALYAIGQSLEFEEGAVVLTYEDEPKGVYVITSGTVACYRNVGGKEIYVDQMSASETFGELWLLADQPTAVRFVAQTHCQIHVIGRDGFNELMDKDGTLARKVYKRFTMRLLKRLLRPQNNGKNQQAS